MNRLAVTVSVAAEHDIRDIAAHIAADNSRAAFQFEEEFWNASEKIGEFAQLGRSIQYSGSTLRMRRVSSRFNRYLIFYRILDTQSLEIVRVLHSARDVGAVFEKTR